MEERDCLQAVTEHYQRRWGGNPIECRWHQGPADELGPHFRVLVFPPRSNRSMWTYATVGMALTPEAGASHGLELHLFAPSETDDHVELLTAVAHYHAAVRSLGWGHTVDFGRPWYPGSQCGYGLISLPYLDGPKLEWLPVDDWTVRCLWLVPITGPERNYKREQGLEALERVFEQDFNYLDPERPSLV